MRLETALCERDPIARDDALLLGHELLSVEFAPVSENRPKRGHVVFVTRQPDLPQPKATGTNQRLTKDFGCEPFTSHRRAYSVPNVPTPFEQVVGQAMPQVGACHDLCIPIAQPVRRMWHPARWKPDARCSRSQFRNVFVEVDIRLANYPWGELLAIGAELLHESAMTRLAIPPRLDQLNGIHSQGRASLDPVAGSA